MDYFKGIDRITQKCIQKFKVKNKNTSMNMFNFQKEIEKRINHKTIYNNLLNLYTILLNNNKKKMLKEKNY